MLIRAYTSIIAACLLWSLNPAANKLALEEIAVPQLVFMRAVFAAFILLLVSFFMGHHFRPKEIGWRPFLLGVLDPGLTSLLFVTSLTVLSASNTVLIMALMPFSQSVLGRVVFKEELRSSVWLGSTLAFSGIIIYFSGEAFNGADTVWGNSLLLAVFCLMAVSQLMTRKIMKTEIPAIQVTSSQMISASVVLFIYLILFGDTELPLQASSGTMMTLLFLVFSMAIPFFLYNQAMRHLPIGMASLLLVLIIPFGFLFAAIILGEEITLIKAIGAILVMTGVAFPHFPKVRRKFI
ncbi:MAG: DMT family transporter [SAR324 cluster bacterium]|jgi:drug/metabolite transporter (DMT)-like permease|nr:DMT family transporter [SAR324 cluster bacterium]